MSVERPPAQRHVVAQGLAERMFPQVQSHTNRHHRHDLCEQCYSLPPSITWLVGPIDCETCHGNSWIGGEVDDSTADPCPDCEHGYPSRVEIVSEGRVARHRVEGGSLSCAYCNRTFTFNMMRDTGPHRCDCRRAEEARGTVHGRVKLGEPVPIRDDSPIPKTEPGWLTHIAPARRYGELCLWAGPTYPENPSTGRPTWTITDITDSIGPCKPGDVAYPITVTS